MTRIAAFAALALLVPIGPASPSKHWASTRPLEYAASGARDSFDVTRQFLDSRLRPVSPHE